MNEDVAYGTNDDGGDSVWRHWWSRADRTAHVTRYASGVIRVLLTDSSGRAYKNVAVDSFDDGERQAYSWLGIQRP